MNDDAALLAIGELARGCGLSISALRFYDRQGILSPAEVDPVSGYRWYAPAQVNDAKLLARLRGIGLPLPEISTILARDDAEIRERILADHISGLEASLVAAREQVSQLSGKGGGVEPSGASGTGHSTVSLSAADLAAGIRTVRHAVGDDPDWPAIHGVYLVAVNRGLRLSATDRHRAAFAEVPAQSTGRMRGLLATADADQLIRIAGQDPSVKAELRDLCLELTDSLGRRVFEAQLLEVQFPDLSHAIPVVRDSVVVSAEELAEALTEVEGESEFLELTGAIAGARYGRTNLALNLVPVRPAAGGPAPVIQLNRAYLADALAGLTDRQDAGESTAGQSTQVQLRFDFDGPADPVAIRRAEDLGTFAVVLPVIPERH